MLKLGIIQLSIQEGNIEKNCAHIEELVRTDNMLPEYNKRGLEQSKETIDQLNMVSETIKDIASTYQEKNDTILKRP